MKKILKVLNGEASSIPPLWLMRQAGRYLPEYRALREKAGDFLDLCFTPKLAAEATLQPIRRFQFDAAILFSDILVVPYAFGQKVVFEKDVGPRLSPIIDESSIKTLGPFQIDRLAPVFETLRLVKAQLPNETALIGFCGAPWTVASYMVAGSGSKDLEAVRLFAYRHPEAFAHLIDLLEHASIAYLEEQARAGAEIVQIFDSWAGLLPTEQFKRWCVEPVLRIAAHLRKNFPDLKIILFPREAGSHLSFFNQSADAGEEKKFHGLGLGVAEDRVAARKTLKDCCAYQGNLDPLALLAGGDALAHNVARIKSEFSNTPFIFNLGHGILPTTPIEHVEQLVKLVREK